MLMYQQNHFSFIVLPVVAHHLLFLPCYFYNYNAIATVASDSEECPSKLTEESLEDDISCELYIAPSSIPDAGLGIFAGNKAYRKGDPVGSGDVAIPVYGMPPKYKPASVELVRLDRGKWPDDPFQDTENPFADYVWDPSSLGWEQESGDDVGLFWPGINAVVNFYPALINLKFSTPVHDNADVHRYFHPGAGAFSPYHKGVSYASRDIPAGGELFKDYGANWLLSRDAFQGVPTGDDFDSSLKLLRSFFELWKESNEWNKKKPANLPPALYDAMKSILRIWDSRVFHALPGNLDSAKNVDGDFGKLHQPNRTRDVSWLDRNGRCLDHIVPKQSTLDGAGNGAFAKRFLRQGTILTGSPLIHVRRHKLIMGRGSPHKSESRIVDEKEVGHPHLLMNYCFGISESSLLLCPYSSGVNYINHNRTLANARVQWASNGAMNHDDTKFDIPPWQFDYIRKPVMAMDYVVTRNIQPGEEIFLDYGEEYAIAWNRYIADWKPEPQWKSYSSAVDFNQIVAADDFLRTSKEQENDPYPENVVLHCHTTMLRYDMQDLMTFGVDLRNSTHMKNVFPWYDDGNGVENGFPCEILERTSSQGFLYDVRLAQPNVSSSETSDDPPGILKRTGVPRDAFRFFDRFQSTDIHLKSTFRHAIGLPKEMIPSAWNDLN